jgi:putative two-component system hydrogenase maturation factor HypX/HoxX
MRILFLCHAFNSLSQRLYVELQQDGHEVSVELDINDTITAEAVERFRPGVIIAPFLKRAIPDAIWRHHVCLVVHPGVVGDRGPSALDWAILEGERSWGVTVLQATGELDAGPVWSAVEFPMREARKASLYRYEVTEAAVAAVRLALERLPQGNDRPQPLRGAGNAPRGRLRPPMRQPDRAIDWRQDTTETVLRKIRAADGFPGVRDLMAGRELFLYDAHAGTCLHGAPGALVAHCGPAVCRATCDGAVWIGHVRDPQGEHPFKLPATTVLAEACRRLPEADGYPDIRYEQQDGVGFLHFAFYNGAMDAGQCERLRQAFREARRQVTRVIVLMGGQDFWSNGMHLNRIEAAESPADESWRNINAIDDLAEDIITTGTHLTVAALQGNAGAGGVFLARCADRVWARRGVILSPHYKDMGNLHGSEFWTYLLPRCAGEANARRIAQVRLPMGTGEAGSLGLVDAVLGSKRDAFLMEVRERARSLAADPGLEFLLEEKNRARALAERQKPLRCYREEELEAMRLNFYGFDPSYHIARYNFVYKVPKSRTPLTIARHRRQGFDAPLRSVS